MNFSLFFVRGGVGWRVLTQNLSQAEQLREQNSDRERKLVHHSHRPPDVDRRNFRQIHRNQSASSTCHATKILKNMVTRHLKRACLLGFTAAEADEETSENE